MLSPALFQFIQQTPNLRQFIPGRLSRRQGMQDQFARRASKRSLEQVSDKLPLGNGFRRGRPVNMTPRGFITPDQPFLGHDLHEFQGGGVARARFQFVENLSDGARTSAPEHTEDSELRVRGTWEFMSWHIEVRRYTDPFYESLRRCQRNLS